MNPKIAIKTLLSLQIIVLLFHLCIVLKFIPYDITWGGRLQNDADMYFFEALSICIILIFMGILMIKGAYFKTTIHPKIINAILWIFLVLFSLNTVGNIFATTSFEKFFAIITLATSFLIWQTLRKRKAE